MIHYNIFRRFYAFPIRTQLLLMAFLLALPAFILIFYAGYLQGKEAINEGIEDGRMLVYSLASEQNNLMSNIEQLLTALGQIPEIKNHDVAAATTILTDILKKNPQYGNIVIADLAGVVWASGLHMTTPLSVKSRRTFREAVKTRQFSSGEYGIGGISAQPTIGFGYPLTDTGGVLNGAIMANINFNQFNGMLNIGGLPIGSTFNIIDRNGVIADRNLDSSKFIGTKIKDDIFLRMKNGPDEDTRVEFDPAGGKFIVSFRKLHMKHEQAPYLYIRVSIPLIETQIKARRALMHNIAFLSPILLLTIFLVIRIGNSCFVKRIGKLQAAAQRLAEGDLQVRVSDVIKGGELGRLGQTFDEMAQKLASRERALVKSEQELGDLYHNAPCGYHSLDKDGFFVRINDTELNWLGYNRDELMGHLKFADIVTPEGSDVLEKSLHLLKDRGWVHSLEFELVRKDGSKLPVLMNATILRDEDGSFLLTRSTVHDITERKRVEEDLNKLNQSLTIRIEAETERRVQQERLLARHARLVAMGEMIGAIAHQWRQPLATLGATIQSIRMAWQRNYMDDSFLERAEADAQKQIYYMSETIEDFRNFFSPEKVVELFDLRGKIDDVVLLVSPQFANAGIGLNVIDNSPGRRQLIKGYPNEFKQSLLNLVGNAFDAILDKVAHGNQPDEGVETSGQVTIFVAGEGNKAVIEVLDNGCGIPAEYADKVFDPYFTTKSGDKGTGIGLYMTKLIIEESMGGGLSFESGPDGTKFKIELALDDSAEGDSNG